MCVNVLPASIYGFLLYVCCLWRSDEGVKSLDLKLVKVVSYGVGFRSQTLVLCKSFKAYNHSTITPSSTP